MQDHLRSSLMRNLLRGRAAPRWIPAFALVLVALLLSLAFGSSAVSDPVGPKPGLHPLSVGTALSGGPRAIGVPASILSGPAVVQSFPGSSGVDGLSSDKTTAVVALDSAANDQEVAMFDEANNSSWVVQNAIPGGQSVIFIQLVSAGGEFYGVWQNLSTSAEIWERFTLSGKVTVPKIPVRSTMAWTFPYGNSTRLFAAAPGFLMELNATSLKVVANYSSPIPANVTVLSLLPVGDRLYLGGYRFLSNGATNAYFGYLNLTSMKLTTITRATLHYPSPYFASFFSVEAQGSNIYVGGGLEWLISYNTTISYHTAQGFLYRFSPSGSTFKNLSSMLPLQSWEVWSIVPWSTTIAFMIAGWGENSSTHASYVGEGIYTLSSSGSSLVNRTALLPGTFVGAGFDDESSSDGWYFVGGYNSRTLYTEAVAIKT